MNRIFRAVENKQFKIDVDKEVGRDYQSDIARVIKEMEQWKYWKLLFIDRSEARKLY